MVEASQLIVSRLSAPFSRPALPDVSDVCWFHRLNEPINTFHGAQHSGPACSVNGLCHRYFTVD